MATQRFSETPPGFVPAAAYDRLQALCDIQAERLLQAEKSDEWKSMDSFPKDNRARLIYCPSIRCAFAVTWDDWTDKWSVFGGHGSFITEEATMWREIPYPITSNTREDSTND